MVKTPLTIVSQQTTVNRQLLEVSGKHGSGYLRSESS
jgi:hypothetical protein